MSQPRRHRMGRRLGAAARAPRHGTARVRNTTRSARGGPLPSAFCRWRGTCTSDPRARASLISTGRRAPRNGSTPRPRPSLPSHLLLQHACTARTPSSSPRRRLSLETGNSAMVCLFCCLSSLVESWSCYAEGASFSHAYDASLFLGKH